MIATRYAPLAAIAAIAAIAALCVSCTGDAPTEVSKGPAATDVIHLSGDSILHAPNDPNFAESRREIRPGVKTSKGGCRFGGAGYLKRGEYAAERVVEVNPVTCDYVVARGVFTHPFNSLANRLPSTARTSNVSSDPDYEEYSQNLEMPSISGSTHNWQRVAWYDPLFIDVVWQRVQSWWDWDYRCVSNVRGLGDARWLRITGWRLGTFDGEGRSGSDCTTHEHLVYGTYHNDTWCAPFGSVSLEVFTSNTPDAIGGLYYDHWTLKDATNFQCNTLWTYWESGV
jgi:hypothetical protein